MPLKQFQGAFPAVPLSVGRQTDYDPELWRKTIRHTTFASARETIEGMAFSVSVSFLRERLSFLQYYGETGTTEADFRSAVRAQAFLSAQLGTSLGPPKNSRPSIDFASFLGADRNTSGPPDERYVEIAGVFWPDGYVATSENAYDRIVTELRLGR